MSRQTCVLDRFEDNNVAVLERKDGTTFDIPAEWLPEDAQEGYGLCQLISYRVGWRDGRVE